MSRLRHIVQSLPTEKQTADRVMRAAILWTDADVRELAHLGAIVVPYTGPAVTQLIEDLNWLAARAASVRNVDPRLGYNWAMFPWPEWLERVARVVETLERLAAQSSGNASVPAPAR